MEVRYTSSASKHGIPQEDALNAILRYRYWVSPFRQSRVEGHPAPDLFIGPALDGRMLEVLVELGQGTLLVFHVMPARARLIEDARRLQ
ncbi:MAG: hypothetical protein L6311_07630 [Cellulomonas sp.]|nr:hypothetical protein [Cellulomonas sp.]